MKGLGEALLGILVGISLALRFFPETRNWAKLTLAFVLGQFRHHEKLGLPDPSVGVTNGPTAESSAVTEKNRSFKFQLILIYGTVIAIVLFVILYSSSQILDKYAPKLNAFLHSGSPTATPTSEGDIDYNIGHLQQDRLKLFETFTHKKPFKEWRAEMLATKPLLDDMHQRAQALVDAWAKEKRERSVPVECQKVIDGLLTAYNQYLGAEDKTFALLRSIDPDSPESVTASHARLDEALDQNAAAMIALQNTNLNMGEVCNEY